MRGQERLPVRDLTGSFFADVLSKNGHPEKLLWYRFDSPKKFALLSLLKEITSSSDCKMTKVLIFDNLFPLLRHSHQDLQKNDDS